jgi:hypothetical protein
MYKRILIGFVAPTLLGLVLGFMASARTAEATMSCPVGCCDELNQACGSDGSNCELPGPGEASCAADPCGNYCIEYMH